MQEIDDVALERALTDACASVVGRDFETIVAVASALSRDAPEDDPRRGLAAALNYDLLVDQRRDGDGAFGPMSEFAGGRYPAPVESIDDLAPGIYQLWDRAIPLSPLALLRARFADLLWEVRFGSTPHEYARTAVRSYIEGAVEDFGHPVERSDAIRRAIEIASQINDSSLRAQAVASAVWQVEESLASEDRMPGVAIRLLETFVSDRPERRPSELDDLLDRSLARFGDDPWNLEAILDLRVRLGPAEARHALWTQQITAFRDLARRSEGLVKYAHFQHAIELAEEHRLHDVAEALRREVEEIPEEDLDLKISGEVSISRAEVEAFVDQFVGDDSLKRALTRFGAHVPTGDPEENRHFVEQLMADHPLQFLFTRMTIGPENSLIRSTAADDQAEQALIDHEAQRASMFSLFAVEILNGIRDRYGPLTSAGEWFRTELIDTAVSAKVVRAIELYESGDYDSAGSLLAPRLERVVRRIAGGVGLAVTRSPDRHGRAGGVKGLGELLGALDGLIPERTRRYLRVLLSEVTALNLRNRIGHGLVDDLDQREAALLIHAACHLRLLRPVD